MGGKNEEWGRIIDNLFRSDKVSEKECEKDTS